MAEAILRDASEKIGGELLVQACSPGCMGLFIHWDLKVIAEREVETYSVTEVDSRRMIAELRVPGSWNPESLAQRTFHFSRIAIEDFSQMKNTGRRLMDLETAARMTVDSLLQLYYHRSHVAQVPIYKNWRERWKLRWWRRQSRALIAAVWLALSNIEMLSRRWHGQRFEFEAEAAIEGKMVLFAGDHLDDATAIESLNLATMRSTVEQIAGRLDNRALVVATAGGALGGR